MAELPANVGDLVLVIDPHRRGARTAPRTHGLIVEVEASGWCRVEWGEPSPEALWFPPAKLQVISRGCEKKEEK